MVNQPALPKTRRMQPNINQYWHTRDNIYGGKNGQTHAWDGFL